MKKGDEVKGTLMAAPIRILHILPELHHGGGMSTVVMNYLHGINHDEFVFDVICHGPCDEDYKAEIERFGGKVILYPPLSLSKIPGSMRDAQAYLRNNRYDVVHCHMANAAFIYLKAAKLAGVPLRILHSHQDHYADTWQHALRNMPIVAMGKRCANCRIACSKKAGDFLFKGSKYILLRNSIPIQRFAYNPEVRKRWRTYEGVGDKTVFANLGRLTLQKNQKYLLDVFSKYHDEDYKSVLYMAGDGELRNELEQYADNLHLGNNVKWLGNVDNVNEMYQGIDVLLFPSLYEGLPMTLVEAQDAGVCCLASNRISDEVIISDFIQFLPIDAGLEPWVKVMRELERGNITFPAREEGAHQVKQAGFDITDTVRDLERIYRQSQLIQNN